MQCIRPPYGVVYVAGKKHYFGVGGGTRQFKHLVEDDGTYLSVCSTLCFIFDVLCFIFLTVLPDSFRRCYGGTPSC